MNKNFTKEFKELSKEDSLIAGGKGASLGEMARAGIPVPNGFVILSNAFEFFLEETDINIEINSILRQVDHKMVHTIDNASKKIQSLILKANFPEKIKEEVENSFKKLNTKFVAVRSSATAEDSQSAAWAGQLDSYLNTTKESLFENIKKCWASLFTPRAIFYRFEKKLNKQKISVAVVIQKMIDSEVSGIAFSVHPVTQDKNQLIIEAGFGLGESIVSGQITPDSYVVLKKEKEIFDKNVYTQTKGLYRNKDGGNKWQDIKEKEGEKQVLSDKEILELSNLILKIENHYDFPCDIEWAKEKNKFFIVQSRPITTLNMAVPAKKKINVNKYEIHTSSSGFSILFLDRIINNTKTYGMVDYVLLYENDISIFYLSKKGMEECREIGSKLLDNDFFNNLVKKSEKLCTELKNYKSSFLNSSNVIKEWKKFLILNDKFCEFYAFYEQPFQQSIESIILKNIPKEELIKVLSTHKTDEIKSDKAKKYLQRLIEMGEMKLKLHKDSERFFTDDSFIRYVAKKNKLSLNFVGAMRKDEIREALDGNIKITKEELKKRLKGCVYVKEENKWNLYTGKEFLYWKKKVQQGNNSKISGDVAFFGKVRGRVVIHLSWTGVTKIKKGDILVTGMTNPQMILMLKNASAIVTDEGGITCHAAIIARELKIPCIVGTQNATQLLKDGDFVEVNANNGVVRVVKKNEGKVRKERRDKTIKKIEWEFQVDRAYIPLSYSFNAFANNRKCIMKYLDISNKGLTGQFFYPNDSFWSKGIKDEVIAKQVEYHKKKGNAYLWHMAKICEDRGKKILEDFKEKIKSISIKDLSKEELESFLAWAVEEIKDFSVFIIIPWAMESYLNDQISNIVKKTVKEDDVQNTITDLVMPLKINSSSKENYAIWELASKINKDKALKKIFQSEKNIEHFLNKKCPKFLLEIDTFVENYGWIHVRWFKGKPINRTSVIDRLKSTIKENPEKRLKELENNQKEIKKFVEDFSAKYSLNKNEEDTIFLVKEYVYIRTYRTDILSQIFYQLFPFLKRIANFLDLTVDDVLYHSEEELRKKLRGEKINVNVKARKESWAVLVINDKYKIFSGKEEVEKAKKEQNIFREMDNIFDVKGITAFKGIVRGKAKIVLDPNDIPKVKKGDVLVSVMTFPSYITAMERAIAFVTDEGGILCHASIIARELKKPCVISTKIATKIFKDGDFVEVNANNGVVRVVKKNEGKIKNKTKK